MMPACYVKRNENAADEAICEAVTWLGTPHAVRLSALSC